MREFDLGHDELAAFYQDRGFHLLGPSDVIDLTPIVGTPYYVKGTDHEQLFVGRVAADYSFPLFRTSYL